MNNTFNSYYKLLLHSSICQHQHLVCNFLHIRKFVKFCFLILINGPNVLNKQRSALPLRLYINEHDVQYVPG